MLCHLWHGEISSLPLTLPPHPVSSLWSNGCTAPTSLCIRRPTAPSTAWSIPLTRRWWICGTRGRWRSIRRTSEATWVWRRWWSRASVFPLEKRWERSTPRCWSSRRRTRSRWGERRVRLHKMISSGFNIWSTVKDQCFYSINYKSWIILYFSNDLTSFTDLFLIIEAWLVD